MSHQEQKPSFSRHPNQTKEHFTFNEAKALVHLETALNQLTEDKDFTYSYNAKGNLKNEKRQADNNSLLSVASEPKRSEQSVAVQDSTRTQEIYFYRYNDFNQLIEHYKANKEDQYIYRFFYTYDGLGRRVTKTYEDRVDTEKSYAHHYLYHNENIIAILDENNNKQLLATILHHPTQVDTPLCITNHETQRTYYYHRDHQGSIIALSNEEGQTIESITYDGHYGEILNHTKEEETFNPYGYTGRETDTKDLYYYRARYYDPTMQRFLSRDPIEFEAGDYNFYRYVSNDCVNFRDPSGLDAVSTIAGMACSTGTKAMMEAPKPMENIIGSGVSGAVVGGIAGAYLGPMGALAGAIIGTGLGLIKGAAMEAFGVNRVIENTKNMGIKCIKNTDECTIDLGEILVTPND